MIVGPDFVWLHFPKCAGTSAERVLRMAAKGRTDVQFDPIESMNVVWHETISQRSKRVGGFDPSGKKIIANIRRLPHWLLSRIHYEASRPPYRIATRDMVLKGCFFEQSGYVNGADTYVTSYNDPPVDFWIRCENFEADLRSAFDGLIQLPEGAIDSRENSSALSYIRDISFYFTRTEIVALYDANPAWAAVEERVYGSLP